MGYTSETVETVLSVIDRGALMMMGARQLVGSETSLRWRMGGGIRDYEGRIVGMCMVEYVRAEDLFAVSTYSARGKEIARVEHVGIAELRATVARLTGCELSVPRVFHAVGGAR